MNTIASSAAVAASTSLTLPPNVVERGQKRTRNLRLDGENRFNMSTEIPRLCTIFHVLSAICSFSIPDIFSRREMIFRLKMFCDTVVTTSSPTPALCGFWDALTGSTQPKRPLKPSQRAIMPKLPRVLKVRTNALLAVVVVITPHAICFHTPFMVLYQATSIPLTHSHFFPSPSWRRLKNVRTDNLPSTHTPQHALE